MTSGAPLLVQVAEHAAMQIPVAAVCLFAVVKGGPAERYGAALYAFSVAVSVGIQIATGQDFAGASALASDMAVAFGFLVLAIRYNNLWLGAAMIVKGLQLALHGSHLTDASDPLVAGLNLYAAALNVVTLSLLIIFSAATVSSIRRRRRLRASARPGPGQASGAQAA